MLRIGKFHIIPSLPVVKRLAEPLLRIRVRKQESEIHRWAALGLRNRVDIHKIAKRIDRRCEPDKRCAVIIVALQQPFILNADADLPVQCRQVVQPRPDFAKLLGRVAMVNAGKVRELKALS